MKFWPRIFSPSRDRTPSTTQRGLSPPSSSGGWWPVIRESFSGAWQRNVTLDQTSVLAYTAVYACITLIASDIAKLRVKLVALSGDLIWEEVTGLQSPFLAVLRKPNNFQNRIQFYTNWLLSKMSWGNTYVLKDRDNRGVVRAMYVLDPQRVRPLVSDDGGVYYELSHDNLAGVDGRLVVPAREIIHDLINPLFHPLVGVSPLFAAGLAATQGLRIQSDSADFFANGSSPGGILTAPGNIADETADRLKKYWDENFTGKNRGKVAVVGDGLKYEPMSQNARDSQLIEQLRWSAENVCAAYHVPPYKVQLGPLPPNATPETINQIYYNDCLHGLLEATELCLDEGLELPVGLGTEFDVAALLRMDRGARYKAHTESVNAGWKSPNEVRREEDLRPVKGGESPMMQQQNYSLAALAERDSDKPFAKPAPAALPAPAEDKPEEPPPDDGAREFVAELIKGLTVEGA